MGKMDKQIVSLLETSGKPLTLVEIAEQMGKSEKSVYRALKKLFSDGTIDCDNKTRKYYLTKEES